MKKQYTRPCTAITHVAMHTMICGSITESGSTLSVTLDNDDTGSFDDNTINSRRGGGFWDE